ncbi:MAG: hypothetical protein ABIP07_03370 [Sphingomicrobium sp.]
MTRKMMLIAGVAGLALTAPASAEKGGKGGEKPQQAEAQKAEARQGGGQRAERPQRQERAQVQRAERPQMQRAERPQKQQRVERPQRAERIQRAERQVQRVERPQRIERQQTRIERQTRRIERPQIERQQQRVERNAKVERRQQRIERNSRIERTAKVERRDILRTRDDRQQRAISTARVDSRSFRPVAALSSGRDMRQMKPFKAKFDDRRIVSIGDRIGSNLVLTSVPAIYGSRYYDTADYYHRYDNAFGTIYRIDRDDGIVRSQFPLFGGYGIGDPWPATYYSSYVPMGYQNYYYDTPDYYYRNDGYGIYQVDSSTQLITALVALLTGQGYGVGQALPASYGAYNVPLDYRDRYADTDDSWYRYGDGYIYQVDPNSRRVAARYPIYTDNYDIGGAWPVAYPDYNVPYGYRSTYYDTPQYQYRYANGGIYQVDPTNQVILGLAALLSGDQFAVGQPLPSGYDSYNVPFDYRDRYADGDDGYYRYANGYVYQVDPRSGLIEEAFPVYA